MEKHRAAVGKIAATVRGFFERKEPFRVFHGSSNSTRPALQGAKTVDISGLDNVISVDAARRVAIVEPNVAMDKLVEHTLPRGLVPPVVMEFPGITAGGGFSGTAGESSSFRHGFFDDSVQKVEMVLADGQVVEARPQGEHADLFRGAAGAVGTLGLTTLLEVRLAQAKTFVRTSYRRTACTAEAVRVVREEVGRAENDYVDGILFSADHGVVITGQLTDEKPVDARPQTFSGAWDPWFYQHVRDRTRGQPPAGVVTEYVPLAEYLFRYDRGGFWVGYSAFRYFGLPCTRLLRWFLDDFLHTRVLYRALHASGESARFVVQDLAMPFETTADFVDYVAAEHGIWPLWLCPLKRRAPPTFHPFTTRPQEPQDDMMLNVGVWGWGPADPKAFVRKNRQLENKVRECGGMKWLYAHTYYPASEFFSLYGGRGWYDGLRAKYRAETLPTVWDKVHVDASQPGRRSAHWLTSMWPFGGLYGIYKAIRGKDYMYHRNARWKWKQG